MWGAPICWSKYTTVGGERVKRTFYVMRHLWQCLYNQWCPSLNERMIWYILKVSSKKCFQKKRDHCYCHIVHHEKRGKCKLCNIFKKTQKTLKYSLYKRSSYHKLTDIRDWWPFIIFIVFLMLPLYPLDAIIYLIRYIVHIIFRGHFLTIQERLF